MKLRFKRNIVQKKSSTKLWLFEEVITEIRKMFQIAKHFRLLGRRAQTWAWKGKGSKNVSKSHTTPKALKTS